MAKQVKDPVLLTSVARIAAVVWVRSLGGELLHGAPCQKKKKKKKKVRSGTWLLFECL